MRVTRLPLFWRLQLAGWALFAIGSFPLKLVAFQTGEAALLVTLVREPLGLLLTCAMRPLYRRLRQPGRRAAPVVLLVAAVCVGAGAADALLERCALGALGWPEEPLVTFGIFCFRSTLYAAWSLLYFWIKTLLAARQRELDLAHAETSRREAELQLLRAQVNPHFLFNALNTIVATLGPDQSGPRGVVDGLAGYLRYSLQHRHDTLVPLGAEFDAAVSYLAVEQARFRGELLVETAITDEVRPLLVPGVLVQPLVENAVKYTRATSIPPHHVRLTARADGPDGATIEVANTGTWVEPATAAGPHGSGLDNLRRRLALLYPGRHVLHTETADGCVIVRLTLEAPLVGAVR